jgi:hypothetical protein
VSRIIRNGVALDDKKSPKIIEKNIFEVQHREFRVFSGVRRKRAESSYPLFLWITMCIRVRKLAVSESGRGLRMN